MSINKQVGVILGAQRSGTTVIGRLLGAQKNTCYVGEIFHAVRGPQDDLEYGKFFTVPEVNFFSYRERLLTRFPRLSYPSPMNQHTIWHCYLDHLYSYSDDSLFIVDIKYNSVHHFNPVWHNTFFAPHLFDLLNDVDAPILHLTRADLFAQAVSEERSHISRRWHLELSEDPGEISPMSLAPRNLENIMARNERSKRHMQAMLTFCKRVDELEYSDIFSNNDLSADARLRLEALFSLPSPLTDPLSLKKMTPADLRTILPNRENVLDYFAGGIYEPIVNAHLKPPG